MPKPKANQDSPAPGSSMLERACLGMHRRGMSNADIAATIGISEPAVELHLAVAFARPDRPPKKVAAAVGRVWDGSPKEIQALLRLNVYRGPRERERYKTARQMLLKSSEKNRNISPAGECIEHKATGDFVEARLQQIDRFVAENPGEPASPLIRSLLSDLGVDLSEEPTQLPDIAPALWAKDKAPDDNPPSFIKRHYAPWLGNGLIRPDIKRLDPQLYVALANWLRNNTLPSDLDLPTLKEANDAWVARVQAGEAKPPRELTAAEAYRLNGAMHRRRQAPSGGKQ